MLHAMNAPNPLATPEPAEAAPRPGRSTGSQLRTHTLALLAFWLAVGALLWFGFSWWEQRGRAALQPYADTGGDLVIPRSPDGHFYVPGEINRTPVRFMVDTGASSVAISSFIAQQARLPDGRPVTLRTANGEREGRQVHDVPVKAGHLTRNDISVTTGLRMDEADEALLGQSFLRHYDVQIAQDRMTLRPR
ncbi:TIGR02281 family clan AA aspartic protease [Ottowia sp. GY511]|nr:TIGR02281 family clan AA aspartic protease [Ottowia sp. GY511]